MPVTILEDNSQLLSSTLPEFTNSLEGAASMGVRGVSRIQPAEMVVDEPEAASAPAVGAAVETHRARKETKKAANRKKKSTPADKENQGRPTKKQKQTSNKRKRPVIEIASCATTCAELFGSGKNISIHPCMSIRCLTTCVSVRPRGGYGCGAV